jgi:CubicO group peptidase (beta-lactamase class C family)
MKLTLTLLIASFAIISCQAQPTKSYMGSNPNQTALDSFINRKADSIAKKENLTGVLIAVQNGAKRNYYNFGFANPTTKAPFDSLTIVEAGSITKTFTAYVLLKVLQQKNISDRTSIITYLPDSVQTNKGLKAITFLHLLNHTSGLPRMPDNIEATSTNQLQPYENYGDNNLYSYLKTCKAKPSEQSNYSNLGAGLAGVLAAKISGLSYEELLQQYIIKPFGIQITNALNEPNTPNKAQGFMEKEAVPYWNMSVLSPAGGVKCNAAAMLTYLQNISLPLAENKSIVDSLTATTVALSPIMSIGRAWHTYERKNKPTIYWHNGGTFGFSTFAGFLKGTNKVAFVVVNEFDKNSSSDGLGMAILNKLLQ